MGGRPLPPTFHATCPPRSRLYSLTSSKHLGQKFLDPSRALEHRKHNPASSRFTFRSLFALPAFSAHAPHRDPLDSPGQLAHNPNALRREYQEPRSEPPPATISGLPMSIYHQPGLLRPGPPWAASGRSWRYIPTRNPGNPSLAVGASVPWNDQVAKLLALGAAGVEVPPGHGVTSSLSSKGPWMISFGFQSGEQRYSW